MYRINVRWANDAHERATYADVQEYQVHGGLLVLTVDEGHQVIVPLFQVTAVDIVEEE